MKNVLPILVALLSSGCAAPITGQANRGTAAANKPTATAQTPTAPQPVGVAQVNPDQLQKLQAAVKAPTKSEAMNQAIAEASPNIVGFIETVSCLNTYNDLPLNQYAAPGKAYHKVGYHSPMILMQFHDKATCVTVHHLHGWEMPAKNALRFEVVYKSESSGESVKRNHELVKQPSGEWLFSR